MIPILSQVEQNEPKQVPVAVSVKEKMEEIKMSRPPK